MLTQTILSTAPPSDNGMSRAAPDRHSTGLLAVYMGSEAAAQRWRERRDAQRARDLLRAVLHDQRELRAELRAYTAEDELRAEIGRLRADMDGLRGELADTLAAHITTEGRHGTPPTDR